MFPAERGCLAVMWPLASHPTNKNEMHRLGPGPRPERTRHARRRRPCACACSRASADLPEGVTRLPIKTVHLNKSPMVVGNVKTLTPAMAQRWGIDMDQAMAHAQLARDLPDMSAIWPARVRAARRRGRARCRTRICMAASSATTTATASTSCARCPASELARARTGFDDPRLDRAAVPLPCAQLCRDPLARGGRALGCAPRRAPVRRRRRRAHRRAAVQRDRPALRNRRRACRRDSGRALRLGRRDRARALTASVRAGASMLLNNELLALCG